MSARRKAWRPTGLSLIAVTLRAQNLEALDPGFSCSMVHFEFVVETKNHLCRAVSGKKSR